MTAVRMLRPPSGIHADPLAGRFLSAYLISLLLHGLLLFGLAGGWLRSSPREDKPPVYYVDLIHKPVLNPQAGRPEPRAKTAPPTPVPAEQVPVKTAVPSKPAPTAKPVPAVKPTSVEERHLREALQRRRDEVALQEKLDAFRQALAVPAEIRVGMPNAKGTEKGVDIYAQVQTTLQNNWALSSYSLPNPKKIPDIEAWVRVSYSKAGRLESFHFEKESGEVQFDESIKRALTKSQQLPQSLPEKLEDVRVVFNLKAMAEAWR